ncbi:cyclopropane-fatty-acyl-phospholipid synthase family protein [Burkholderia sp. Ac-20365]|uniref:SAM-dependent methyltransferase n=1 Tax=Burkholderia sp. Ac-20365 TaxID=2703897 RepID=UPI00197C1AAE|nr:cyclopropane-fatty-acyl-phospholipid synthase family protein [Burkholderia sp. Ac-20365]MBN3759394.1 class I SAM-dependent methyltransferase [Burkholderia sp. Ac-20365]
MTFTATQSSIDHAKHAGEDWLIHACEHGWLPDRLIRFGMRRVMRQRLIEEGALDHELHSQRFNALIDELRASPIAIETDAANAQHYELPPSFFKEHLGPHLKYSCCFYPRGDETLERAEQSMLELYAERAQIEDGQTILDLGCGWGALAVWLAARYPRAQIVALSNSRSQREFIEARAASAGITNLRVVTGNVVQFEFSDPFKARAPFGAGDFDRVLSIEMFEHMKNYDALLERIARWMRPDGKLFVHIFAHRTLAYHFQTHDTSDWMSKYFFTGGTMPSEALLRHFQRNLRIDRQWWIDGTHYARTAEHWLMNLDRARGRVMPELALVYGVENAAIWFQRWRMFYMAVAELFGYARGNEWGIAHYLFDKR